MALRRYFPLAKMLGLDDRTFATAFVSLFMQIMGILQIPAFLGPSFTPFTSSHKILNPWRDPSTWTVGKPGAEWTEEQQARKKKKKRKKKLKES